MADESSWRGCESFPGFGSASALIQLNEVTLAGGDFNVTTQDFITSRVCSGSPDLIWSHSGVYQCLSSNSSALFARKSLWLEASTNYGLAFGKVLCPSVSLSLHIRTFIPIKKVSTLCSGVTFDNCGVYYDTLLFNATDASLRRSQAPTCDTNKKPQKSDGPVLTCVSPTCYSPCSMNK